MAQVNAGRVRFVSRGEYNNSTQYYTLDLVNYDGSSYYAKENVVGVLPTDNTKWQLVAEKGSIGSTGPTGPSGFSPSASVTQLQNGALISITDETGTTTANISNGEVTNKEFEYYKTIANVLPKVEDEDTELTLNNTGNAPLSIGLKGNTYQETTKGVQLANFYSAYYSSAEHEIVNGKVDLSPITSSRGVTFKFDEITLPAGDYCFAFNPLTKGSNTSNQQIGSLNATFHFMPSGYSYCDFTLTEETTLSQFGFWYTANYAGMLENIILFSGTHENIPNWEQYTGGNPAPNPDYPQDIHLVSGNNTITISNSDGTKEQVYPINLGNIELCKIGNYQDDIRKSTGKNLFDKTKAQVGMIVNTSGNPSSDKETRYSDYIYIKGKNSIILSGATITYGNGGAFYNENKEYVSGFTSAKIKNGLSVPNDVYYVRFNTLPADIDTTQLEEGSQATYWEPFGIKWIKYGAIGKVVLDGSEDYYTMEWTSGKFGCRTNIDNLKILTNANEKSSLVSNNFTPYSPNGLYGLSTPSYGISNRLNQSEIIIRNDNMASVSDIKNWLSTHNTEVRYVLATPEITEITDSNLISQLDAIEYAMSYKEQTNISQENNDMPFVITASAFKDLSNL